MIAKTMKSIGVQLPLVVWTLLATVPFVLIMLLGFRDNNSIYDNPLGIGGEYHPENFITAWIGPTGSAGMGSFFVNSLTAVTVAVVLNITLGALGAYFISRLPRKYTPWYLGLFIMGTVVPHVLLIIPYYGVLNGMGLLSQSWVLGIVYAVLTLPTTVLVLSAHFADFPGSIIEAGRLDGLSEIGVFRRLVLPMSSGSLVAVAVIAVISVWGETQIAYVLLAAPESQTVPIGVLGFKGLYSSELGPLFAGLSMATVPVIVFYLVFHRYITKGLALGGAVK
jgi:raffinose/stachyose/melibiose transport system permease protein